MPKSTGTPPKPEPISDDWREKVRKQIRDFGETPEGQELLKFVATSLQAQELRKNGKLH